MTIKQIGKFETLHDKVLRNPHHSLSDVAALRLARSSAVL